MGLSCMHKKMRRLQSDCVQAFTQAEMDVETFVSLPRAWWPKEWANMKDPVCPLRLALYGHPKSGDLWHDKLDAVLKENGFETSVEWPSLYWKNHYSSATREGKPEHELFTILVYVDDLLIFGSEALDPIIAEIRSKIEMEEPKPIDQ